MKLLFFIVLLLVPLLSSDADLDYTGYTFETYLSSFSKSYDGSEYLLRKNLFESRLKQIIEHNNNPTYTWKEGVNQFTDMTNEERSAYLGLNKALLHKSQFLRNGNKPTFSAPVDPKALKDLPSSVDWRTAGIITAVKNQGQCGSCWTFGAAEGVESVYAQKNNKQLVVLSEQNILDCTPNPQHCGGTGGCEGGTVELAWDRIKTEGIATEKDYPYISGNNGRDYSCKKNIQPFTNITSYVNLPTNQQQPIMDALANIGPLAINVDASSWFGYRSGVYDGCNQKNPDVDHVVQLVGYGTDSQRGDYWLVRNSWGVGYGEKGYIRLKRESGNPRCGIDKKPSDGIGCDGGPPTVIVCGTCGVLYDALYPVL